LLSYRSDIDGLRALAVVPVVLFHAGIPGFGGGYVGVDVFFVISGFLIAGFLLDDLGRGYFSLVRFYERRARRILPALIAVIASSTVVGYFMLLPSAYIDLSKSAIAAALFGANIWFSSAASDYFAPAVEFMPLLHTWSLGVEEQFYIVFPLLLWFLARWNRSTMLIILAALSLLSFAFSVSAVRNQPEAAFYLTPARAWELGLGALLALYGQSGSMARWSRELLAGIGLLCILAAVVLFDGLTPFPGTAALLPCLGAAALILAGGQGSSLVTRFLSWRPLVFVGLISYSLYLWHWPILSFLRVRFSHVDLPPEIAAGAITASFGIAVLSWKYIEMPFRRRPPKGPRAVTVVGVTGGAMAALVVISMVIWWRAGLPERIPAEVRMAYAAARDNNPAQSQCFNKWPESGLCSFPDHNGEDRRPAVLLWGDSHADAIMPGVSVAAERAGVSGVFAGMNACPPLLNVDRADKGPEHGCARFNQSVLEYLRAHEHISLVILAARWALAAEAVRAPGEPGNPALLVPAGTDHDGRVSVERNFEVFQDGIDATVSAILSMGRRVVIIGNIPEIGWHVPAHAISHTRWGDSLPPAPTIEAVARRQGRADGALARLAEQPGVRFLPIARRLCDPECRTHVADRPIYLDDDHLNRFGSVRVIAPLLIVSIRPLADQ